MSEDWMEDLGLDELPDIEELEEEELEEAASKPSKKKASKKKAGKKKASKKAARPAEQLEEEEIDEIIPAKPSKKKASKKKAARKPAEVEETVETEDAVEAEDVAEAEITPAPRKKKATAKRGRKPKVASSDVLSELNSDLRALMEDAGNSSEIDRLKAEVRSGKKLSTQLNRFSDRVAKAAAAQEKAVEKLEARLASLEAS